MGWLRLLLLIGSIAAIVLSMATASWEADLVRGHHTWMMNLGRHPVWQPPAVPGYETFREHFNQSPDFPIQNSGCIIRVSYDPVSISIESVFYFWPVTCVCGLAYRSIRGTRRDPVLQCALSIAVSLPIAMFVCVALWCVGGGWGPPVVGFFVFLGMIFGILNGLSSLLKLAKVEQ